MLNEHAPRIARALARLAEIPSLASEVEHSAGVGVPNPGGERVPVSKPVPGSRPPISVAALYASWPAGPGVDTTYRGQGLRGKLAMAVRMVIEELAEQDRTAEIPEWPADTWEGICSWLIDAADLWAGLPWSGDIVADIGSVWGELAQLARVPRLNLRCPDCGEPLHRQPGDYYRCASGVHQHPGGAALLKQWRTKKPLKAVGIVELFRTLGIEITEGQIRVWVNRGKLRRAGKDGRKHLYRPWDVLLIVRPDLAEEGAA